VPPLVTVVIPCYNAEKWIGECIHSVQRQDYSNVEIVVVDDCSTDKSVDRIVVRTSKFPCRLIRNPVNMGECKTSARGFSEATGKYICRLSADDMFVNDDHITRQVKEMEGTNCDWCYNNINLVGESLNISVKTQTAWAPIPIRYSANFLYVFDNLFLRFPRICYLIAGVRNPINSSALMFRASTMLSWDSDLRSVCDGVLLSKMLISGLRGRVIHSMGAFYRIHSGQATGKEATNGVHSIVRTRIYGNTSLPYWMKICAWFIKRVYDIS
jgi:glycosyltransferase involved in cell wall biosynthesis